MVESSSGSSSSGSSSSSTDSNNEEMKSSSSPQKLLLHDDDDESSDDDAPNSKTASDNNNGLSINADYAREYEKRKRREELTKHRKVNFDLDDDRGYGLDGGDDDDDSSTSEDEDEEGELLTPHLDAQIVKTLKALKRKDDSVYDRNATFYDKSSNSDGNGDDESSGTSEGKMKRKTYKDVVREQILEQMDDDDDGDSNSKKKGSSGGNAGDFAYDEEQRDIRRAFLESTRDSGNDESGNGSDEDWIKPKAKSKASFNDQEDDDEEARKLWEQELQDMTTSEKSKKKGLMDPHGEVQDGEQFLMEFMTHKKWLERGVNKFNPDNVDDDDQSLEDLDRMDAFESKYNFRFEEAAAAADNANMMDSMPSGASHSIVHYARGSNAENVLRRKDESRRQKRLARKERKAEERKAKEEQLRRLKNAKREELDERMNQVRNVLGGTLDGKAGDGAIGIAEEEMILKLMEADYNPENFEQVMSSVYGDEYYQKEEEVWKNDQDVKRDLAGGKEESDILGDGEMYDEEDTDGNYDEDVGDEDYEHDDEYDEDETHFEANNKETEMDKKLKNKMMDELYKLDYEDIIGDMPTRFKYRTVEKNSFGLSTEEILFAKDSTLKQFVSLKKMATYTDEEYQPGTKRRKRFRQMLKTEQDDMKDEVGAIDEEPSQSTAGNSEKKKKRRRQKKGSKKSTEHTPAVANKRAKETNDDAKETAHEQHDKKQGTGKMNEQKKGQDLQDENLNVDAVETREDNRNIRVERKKTKKNKAKDGGKKKRQEKHSSKVEGLSGARLAAYGF